MRKQWEPSAPSEFMSAREELCTELSFPHLFFGDRWLLLSIYSQEFVDVIYHKKLCKISMN